MKLFADNLIRIEEKDLIKYNKLKEGSDIEPGDVLHISDEVYAEIYQGHIICKEKVSKYNIFLRKK